MLCKPAQTPGHRSLPIRRQVPPRIRVVAVHSGNGGGYGSGGGVRKFGRGDENPGGGRNIGGGNMGLLSLASVCLQLAVGAGTAQAKKQKEPEKKEPTIEEMAENLTSLAGPILSNLGFSGCIGVATGITLKKVGQLLALLIGLMFCALQGLTYLGFIDLKWQKIHKTIEKYCDINGDGKVDEKDLKHVMGKGLGALAEGVPSAGGFLAGFALGVRVG